MRVRPQDVASWNPYKYKGRILPQPWPAQFVCTPNSGHSNGTLLSTLTYICPHQLHIGSASPCTKARRCPHPLHAVAGVTAPSFWQAALSSEEEAAPTIPPDHPGRRPPAGAQAAAAAAAGQYRTSVQKHPDPVGHPAEGDGSSAASRAGGSSSGPTPAPTQGPSFVNADRRVSGLAPRPDESTLHGGWELGEEVYNRLLRHPNVTVLSRDAPRVLHFRQLLSVEEAEHLIALATGEPSEGCLGLGSSGLIAGSYRAILLVL